MSASSSPSQPSPEYLAENNGGPLLATAVAFIVLQIVFVTLRFAARWLKKRPIDLDDYFIVSALLFCLGLNATSIAAVRMGVVGRHKEAIALEGMPRLVMFSRIHFAEEILCLLATALPKAAILYVYWRVFVGRCRLAIAVAAFFVFGVFISGLFSAFFACSPSEAVWDVSVTPDHCIDVNAFYRWIGVPNTMTDVAILVIPLPIVWRLHAATEQKISLTFAFFTGSIGLGTSIARMYFFFTTDSLVDPPWTSSTLILWSLIEPGVYLFAACLPACRPIVLYILGFPDNFMHGSKKAPRFFRGGHNIPDNVAPSDQSKSMDPESLREPIKRSEEDGMGSSTLGGSTQGSFTLASIEGYDYNAALRFDSKEAWQGSSLDKESR